MDEIETKNELSDQHFWNIVFLVISVAVFVVFMALLGPDAAGALSGVTPFQFIVLALATFRLTRLLVADHIMLWLRDMCVNVNEETNPETGLVCIVREKPQKGIRLLFANLLGCPWCVSVWVAFIIIALYMGVILDIFPIGRVIIYVFALAGAASIIQAVIGAFMAQRATDGAYAEPRKEPWRGQERRANPNVCTSCGI